ncbi:MAG: UDP-N-acetylmuramoyl-L-alanyl-D-glutamate--2,6-diaminopimelate ligase [Planctomycetota bacterium]
MRLSDLVGRMRELGARVDVRGGPDADVEVTSVVTDSRKVTRGALFCALRGARADGAAFIEDAATRGAAAAIAERAEFTPLAQLVVPDARAAMRLAAWALWGNSIRDVRLAGVTGTNGKTTVVTLLRDMLGRSGRRAGLVGTLGLDVGDGLEPTGFTTPETADILGAISRMRARGMAWGVLEVSSHALALGRVFQEGVGPRGHGLDLEIALFTNLSREHLDFHGSMEAYLDAKAKLFESLRPDATAILNAEDPASAELAKRTAARVMRAGIGGEVDVRAEEVAREAGAKRVRVSSAEDSVEFLWRHPGRHNVLNLAVAAGGAVAAGVPLTDLARAAEAFAGVPGRLESVDAGQPFRVLVDYAHTPDALERLLESLRPETEGRLICVFGCGGDRDRTKRPLMGEAVERLADVTIVTSDNPRSEDPDAIIAEIMTGVRDASRARVEPDRARAIELAVGLADEGDVVVLAGKGHEPEQIVGDERRPFDDRLVAREALDTRAA